MNTTTPPNIWQRLSPIPLRLMLGFGFLIHGYPKLFTNQGNEAITGMLAGIGIPAPALSAYMVGGLEFFGGILLILGVAVRTVSVLGGIEMLGAAVTVHAAAGFNFLNATGMTEGGQMQFGLPGYEVNLLYLAGFLTLVMTGSGAFSIRIAKPDRRHAMQDRVVHEPVEESAGIP